MQKLTHAQFMAFSIAVFSLQVANKAQTAYTSGLLTLLGAQPTELSFLWIAAPLSGLLVQLVIGPMSDMTQSRYGKRRPYLFATAILACITTICLPYSSHLWTALIQLWLFYLAQNAGMAILRALIGDVTPDSQLAHMYSLQNIFTALGAILAGMLPWLLKKWLPEQSSTMIHELSLSVKIVFIISAAIGLLGMLWLVFNIKEPAILKKSTKSLKTHFVEYFASFKTLPDIIKYFIPAQFFIWIGEFAMWVYFPLALAQHFYGLAPNADIMNDAHSQALLEAGGTLAAISFAAYQSISIVYSYFIPKLVTRYSEEFIYGAAGLIGGLGVILCLLAKSMIVLVIGMLAYGIMVTAVNALPYIVVTRHIPKEKSGTYLGIFNLTVTAPQIVCGLALGAINAKLFNNNVTHTILLVGGLIVIGGVIALYQARNNVRSTLQAES